MPAGFKVFENGAVLTSAEVMGFMMRQQVCVFEDATARDEAIPSPEHGQFAFLRDSNEIVFYDSSIWKAL